MTHSLQDARKSVFLRLTPTDPTRVSKSPRWSYKRARTAERGYGGDHQAARRQVARRVEAGGVSCSRCGGPIMPDAKWDLDHSDDRGSYLGAAHAACNRRAGAAKRHAKRLRLTVRVW